MAYWDLSPKAAPGVDGVTWDAYGQDLVANLRDLHARVQQGRYRARVCQLNGVTSSSVVTCVPRSGGRRS